MISRPTRQISSWSLVLGATCFALAGGRPALAQIQPDRLDFGTVHIGGRVDGSVRIFVDPAIVKGAKADVTAPPFVKIRHVAVGTQDYGAKNTKGYCDIAVSVETVRAGDFAGPIVMKLGDQRVEVPIRAKVLPREARPIRVLVADTPFQKFSTSNADLFNPWLKLVEKNGLDVDYREVHTSKPLLDGVDLGEYDVVLLGEMGLLGLRDSDVDGLKRFAEKGGRVVLTANHFFRGTVGQANKLLNPYGLKINDVEPEGRNDLTLNAAEITKCPLTDGIKSLNFFRASPVEVTDPDRTMVLVPNPDRAGESLVALGVAGDGDVVSLGVSLWWSWVSKADNATLMGNLLRRRSRPE